MDSVMLRKADPADAAALGALHVASWRETYDGIVPDGMLASQSADVRAAMWSQILNRPEEYGRIAVFVVEDGGRIIGFGACGRQRDVALANAGFTGEIGALYVLRTHQGRGAGRSLMAALAQMLAADGHVAASLWVLRDNRVARGFYEKLGATIVGEKADEDHAATLIEVAYGWNDLACLLA